MGFQDDPPQRNSDTGALTMGADRMNTFTNQIVAEKSNAVATMVCAAPRLCKSDALFASDYCTLSKQ